MGGSPARRQRQPPPLDGIREHGGGRSRRGQPPGGPRLPESFHGLVAPGMPPAVWCLTHLLDAHPVDGVPQRAALTGFAEERSATSSAASRASRLGVSTEHQARRLSFDSAPSPSGAAPLRPSRHVRVGDHHVRWLPLHLGEGGGPRVTKTMSQRSRSRPSRRRSPLSTAILSLSYCIFPDQMNGPSKKVSPR